MKILPAVILLTIFISGCTAPRPANELTVVSDGYHGIAAVDLETLVLVDTRFTERESIKNSNGTSWLFTDYEGQPDQEFIIVFLGTAGLPELPEGTSEINTPIGPAFEHFFATELSHLSLDKLSEKHGFTAPACGYGRQLLYDAKYARKHLSVIYIEGEPCASAFQHGGEFESLRRSMVRTRAETVVKLKAL